MSSIDEKVVSLKFDNKQFEKGAAQSISTLDNLKKSMDVSESAKSLKELSKVSKQLDFSGLEKSISNIENRFSRLGIAGMTAIQDVTRFAERAGVQVARYLTVPLNQIKSGGISRAMNIEQATFQLKGMGLAWKEVRQNALDAVSGTAYGLDEAVKIASQLGASGVQAGKDMKNSLQGIAGVAAMTGRSYEDVGNIFATIASNGKVMTMQLRQLSASGLNAASTMAKYFGKSEAEINDMVSKGKISFAEFNEAMQATFSKHAKEANSTFTGAMSNVRAALSRIGEGPATAGLEGLRKLFVSLIPLIDSINVTLTPFLNHLGEIIKYVTGFGTALAQNKTTLGIINNIIKGLYASLKYVEIVLKTIAKAFLDVFPPKQLNELLQITRGFKNFAKNLELSEKQAEDLRTIARGLFSVLGILKDLLTLVSHVLIDIAKSPVGSFILKVAKKLSQLAVNIEYVLRVIIAAYDYTVSYFGGLKGVFENFGFIVYAIFSLLAGATSGIGDKVRDVCEDIKEAVSGLIPSIGDSNGALGKLGDSAQVAADKIKGALGLTKDKAKESAEATKDAVQGATKLTGKLADQTVESAKKVKEATKEQVKETSEAVKQAEKVAAGAEKRVESRLQNNDAYKKAQQMGELSQMLSKVFVVLEKAAKVVMGAVGKVVQFISAAFSSLIKIASKMSLGDIINMFLAFNINNLIGSLTNGFQAITGTIQDFFKSISKISMGKAKQVENINKALKNVSSTVGAMQHSIKSNIVLKIAISIMILAGAIMMLSQINLMQLGAGLGGIAVLMGELLLATYILKKIDAKGIDVTYMMFLASAIKTLSEAVVKLKELNMDQTISALIGIAGAMGVLVGAAYALQNLETNKLTGIAISMIVMSVALKGMAGAINKMGSLDIPTIAKGLVSLTIVLAAIGGFATMLSKLEGKISVSFGFALIEVAAGVAIIAQAVKAMSGLNISEIVTGLAGLIVVLAAIGGFAVMLGKLDGKITVKTGFAIVEMAAGLVIIAQVVRMLGSLNIAEIITGLAGLVVVLATIGGLSVMIGKLDGKLTMRMGFALIEMSAAIAVMAKVAQSLGSMDLVSLAKGVGAITIFLAAVAGFSVAISKWGAEASSVAYTIIPIALGISSLAKAVERLAKLDIIQMAAGTAALVVLLREFVKFSDELNEFDLFDLIGATVMLNRIGASINNIAKTMQTLAGLSPEEAMVGIVAFAASMYILNKAIEKLCEEPSIMKVGWSMSIAAGAILNIASSVTTLGKTPIDQVVVGLGAFSAALFVLVKALDKIDGMDDDVTKQFLLLAAAMAIFAPAITLIANIDMAGAASGIVILAGAMGILIGSATLISKKLGDVALALAILAGFAGVMLMLAPAFTLMGNIPLAGIAGALIAVGGSLTILAVAARLVGPYIGQMEKLIGVISKMSRGFLVFAAALGILALSLQGIIMAFGAKVLGDAFSNLGTALSQAAESVAKGVVDIIKAIVNAVSDAIPYLVDKAFEMVLQFIQGVADAMDQYLPIIMDALGMLVGKIIEGLKKWFSEFDSMGTALAVKIGAALVSIMAVLRMVASSASALNPKNFKSLIVIAAMLVASMAALMFLAEIPWPRLLSATAAFSATLLSLAGAMKIMSTAEFDWKQIAAMGVGIVAIGAIATALYFVAQQDWASILAAGASISAALLAFSVAFDIASVAVPNIAGIALFLLASVSLIPIAGALWLVAQNPWESILAAGAALVGALLAFGAVFAVVSLIPVNIVSIGTFLIGSLAILPIAFALKMIAESADFQAILAAGAVLCDTLLTFGAVFAIMALIPAVAAVNAVATIAIALGGLIGILLVLGGLNQIPGFSWLIGEGSKVIGQVGEAIGGFFGSIVAGFAQAATSALGPIGTNLSEFMTNAQPFFDGVAKLDQSTVDSVGALADAIMTLTGASLLNAIGDIFEFFTGQSAFDSLGENLKTFGEAMGDFSEATKDIVPENINLLAEAAMYLSEAIANMPKEGGLAQFFSGTTNLEDFGNQAEAFGNAMTRMSDAVENIKLENIEKVKAAGEMMAALADAAPSYNGLVQSFMGEKDLGQFGRNVESFGNAMSRLSASVEGKIDLDTVETVKNAGMICTELANAAPSYDGLVQSFMGNKDLGQFGRNLESFGMHMTNFGINVKDLETDAVTNAATVGQMLTALINGLPNSGGVAGWWSGEKDLNDLGAQLPEFGESLAAFGDKVKNMKSTDVYAATSAMNSMNKLFTEVDGQKTDIAGFTTNLSELGEVYKTFNTDISAVDETKINTFVDNLKLLLKTFSKKFKADKSVDYKVVQKFSKNIKNLNDAVNTISGDNATQVESFKDALTDLGDVYKTFATDIKTVSTSDINTFTEQVKSLMDAFATKKGATKMNFKDLKSFGSAVKAISEASSNLGGSGSGSTKNFEKNLKSLGKAYKTFGTNIKSVPTADVNAFKEQVKTLNKVAKSLKKADTSGMKAFGESLSSIGEGANQAIDEALSKIQNKLKDFTEAGKTAVTNVGKGIKSKNTLKDLTDAAKTARKKAKSPFEAESYLKGIKTAGKNVTVGFKNGLLNQEALNGVSEAGRKIGQEVLDSIKKKTKENSPSKATMQMGDYATQGFAIGLGKNLKAVTKASNKIGEANLEGIRDTLKIHSPSIMGFELGNFSVQGFIDGIKAKAGEVVKASSGVGDSFLGGLFKSLDLKKAMEDVGGKDSKDITKGLGKDLGTNVNKELSKGSGGGGGRASTQDKVKWTHADTMAKLAYATIINGIKESKKLLAKEMKISNKEAASYLSAFTNEAKKISDKAVHWMTRTPDAVVAYAKATRAANKYIKNFVKGTNSMVKQGLSTVGKTTTAAMTKFGETLWEATDEYKEAQANIKAISKDIAKNNKTMKDLDAKIAKARKKGNNKRAKELLKEYKELAKSTKSLRKQVVAEWEKIGAGSATALAAMQADIASTLREMISFGDFDLSDSRILSGLDAIEESTEKVNDGIDVLEVSMKTVADAADSASKAYDGLSASMDTGLNLFERFTKTGTVESDALFENADSQLEAYEEFQNGIAELEKKGLDYSVIDELFSQGPQALNQIRGFLSMSDDQIASYNKRIDKKNEYAAKALERNLKRQYQIWEQYAKDISELGRKFGVNFASNPVYQAILNSGINSSDMVSLLTKMDSSTFDSVVYYIGEGLKDVYSTASDEVKNVIKSTGEATYSSLVEGMKANIEKKNLFSTIADQAKEAGLDEGFVTWIQSKGYDTGMAYFMGLGEAIRDESGNIVGVNFDPTQIDEAKKIWAEYGEAAGTDFVENLQSQVKAQNNNLEAMSELRGHLPDVLRQIASANKGMSADALGATLSDYEGAFNTLVEELKAKGLDGTSIVNQLNKWIRDGNWDKVNTALTSIMSRDKNNAIYTAEAVQATWNQKIKDMQDRSQTLLSINKKLDSKMSMSMFNMLKEMSVDDLKALDTLDTSQLQDMAQAYYDADYATDFIANQILVSVQEGVTKGDADARAWLASYNYDTEKTKKTSTQNDWLYEIATYFRDRTMAGASLQKIVDEIMTKKTVGGSYKDIFYFAGSKYGSQFLTETMEGITYALRGKGNKTDAEVIEMLTNGEFFKSFTGADVGNIIGGAVSQAYDVKGDVASAVGSQRSAIVQATIDAFTSEEALTDIENVQKTQSEWANELVPDENRFDQKSITKKKQNMVGVLTEVGEYVASAAEEVYTTTGNNLGDFIDEGVIVGINDGSNKVTEAAENMALAAYQAACNALGIKSPSKEFAKIGNFMAMGMAEGIANSTNIVDESVISMSESTLDSMRQTIAMVADALNGGLDLNPVITPTLDLSEINRQAHDVGGTFNASIAPKSSSSEETAKNQNGGVIQNFTQNNYSPKALSREEIYRQTRNQFSMARKVVEA